jgi:uncharacterized protein
MARSTPSGRLSALTRCALARRAGIAALAALLALLVSLPALAFTPPTLDGHVIDTASALRPDEILALDKKLEDVRVRTGFEIVAFVVGSLEGQTKEDVAYETFQAWHIGKKGLDNGVLLLIAPNERKTFIATGKGVEGQLTDLQADDILNEKVIPSLKEGHVFDAVDRGTTAIARTLAGEAGDTRKIRTRAPPRPQASPYSPWIAGGALAIVLLLSIVSPGFRAFLWIFIELFLFRGGGGRGGGGGSGGGSGYGGGGGSTGGGGAGEDY